jgi:hypothetical protein
LKKIVKGTKLVDITTPFTPAVSTDELIILYPRAFSSQEALARTLLHEIVHFLVNDSWSKTFAKYKKDSGWGSIKTVDGFRSGEFVDQDGKMSADEDFANNVEYFVFAQKSLKETSPKIFDWIQNNLKNDLKREKGCEK